MYGHGVDEKVLEAEAKSTFSVKDLDKARCVSTRPQHRRCRMPDMGT